LTGRETPAPEVVVGLLAADVPLPVPVDEAEVVVAAGDVGVEEGLLVAAVVPVLVEDNVTPCR
jgi:hypothetical protein